jgi:hypothetical protein
MDKSQDEMITAEILDLFDETFENVHGYYLDKGTSLFEKLNPISSSIASKSSESSDYTIASHIEHINFYIKTLIGYMNGEIKGKTDWNKSWTVKSVSDVEWSTLKDDLAGSYKLVKETVKGFTYWKNEDDFSGIISILVHTAFHMGAIWKMLEFIDSGN